MRCLHACKGSYWIHAAKEIGNLTSGLKVFTSLKTCAMLNLFFPICEDGKSCLAFVRQSDAKLIL